MNQSRSRKLSDAMEDQEEAPAAVAAPSSSSASASASATLEVTTSVVKKKKKAKKEKDKGKKAARRSAEFHFFGLLPPELQLEVMKHVDYKALARLAQVSKATAALANIDWLWSAQCHRNGLEGIERIPGETWRNFFVRMYHCKTLILHNDDTTNMLEVICRLQNCLGISTSQSRTLMLAAHASGQVSIFHGPRKECLKLEKKIVGGSTLQLSHTSKLSPIPFHVIIKREDWVKVASVDHWATFKKTCQEHRFTGISQYSYASHCPPEFLVYQGTYKSCQHFVQVMGRVFDFMQKPDLFKVRFVNSGLFQTPAKSLQEVLWEFEADRLTNPVSLDAIAENVPENELESESSLSSMSGTDDGDE